MIDIHTSHRTWCGVGLFSELMCAHSMQFQTGCPFRVQPLSRPTPRATYQRLPETSSLRCVTG